MYDELHIQNGTLHVQNTIYVLLRADYAYANRNVHCDKIILNNLSFSAQTFKRALLAACLLR